MHSNVLLGIHELKTKQMSEPTQVRILAPADAEKYREVRLQALHEHPPAFGSLPEDEPNLTKTAARLAQSDDQCFFGSFQGEQLAGIIRLSRYLDINEKHRAYIAGLYVLPLFRGKGCGRALVREALNRAAEIRGIRRVNLTVGTQQEAAIKLYKSLGFEIYGTEVETFSSKGVYYDEHLMTLATISNKPKKQNKPSHHNPLPAPSRTSRDE